ncbi:hypothetical protein COV93_03960 [Candidatus Woesearchaeota archaeon CG11_big_fil_rev_8_21_14_0_20_43_8]|nr:MAG: hypothetical protein COV93_03960 [Candidatus Woesearchaeota archaeon CG11_big_fil_rev_8_21_14_0_20_43_8]PIO04748.1 MAG: hypothetical protein COT47_07680 [Candidatus Woesearchaeota archaeon CG08_land_8_20_14_0_20_43_7]
MPKKKANKEKLVKDYVIKEENKGFHLDQIKKRLLDAGYQKSEIDSAIKKYNLDTIQTSPKRKINWRLIGWLGGIAAVIIVIMLWFFFPMMKDCKSDQNCFVEYANKCKPAKFSNQAEGTIFKYATDVQYAVTEDCTLKKGIDKLDLTEPPEIKALFEGKSMTCSYTKGNFDTQWLTTITKGLDDCDGPLKVAIYEMIIALYEVANGS